MFGATRSHLGVEASRPVIRNCPEMIARIGLRHFLRPRLNHLHERRRVTTAGVVLFSSEGASLLDTLNRLQMIAILARQQVLLHLFDQHGMAMAGVTS